MAARPATRRLPDRKAPIASRPAVRNFTGNGEFAIEWDVRPVYDFLFSLSDDAGSTDDLPAADRAWLTESRTAHRAALRPAVRDQFDTELAIHVAAFAVERPNLRTAREFVDGLKAADEHDVIVTLLAASFPERGMEDLLDRAARGNPDARAEVLRRLGDDHYGDEKLTFLDDPSGTYRAVVEALDAWADVFSAVEPRVASMLERDYDLRAGDRATLTGPDLVEQTTGGIRWLSEQGVRRVILAPSYFSRPYNFLLGGRDWRFFGYPLADEALDGKDPLAAPQSVVRLHRALGDETRLRILKLLAGKDLYLTEIAQQLDLSKPTIKHHLALLRASGLVTITESGSVMYYSLRRPRLDDASTELKRFLVP